MSNFAFLATEFPAVHEAAAAEARRRAEPHLQYGNIHGTI
jgi:hypothetical protein